jgi:hypothetical protein
MPEIALNPPLSTHTGRRGRLGVLMPETEDGRQGLPQKPPPVSLRASDAKPACAERELRLGSRLSALGYRLSALGSRLSAIDYRLSAIGYRLSAIGYQLSAISYRLSAISYRLSAIGYRLSAIGYRLSTLGYDRATARCSAPCFYACNGCTSTRAFGWANRL